MKKRICIILALLGLINLPPAFAEERMSWGIYDWPPIHIVKGEHKGKGIFDALMYHFQKKLPEYTHDHIIGNSKRFWKYIREEANFCYVASIVTPERLKYAYFSMPDAILISNTVVMRKGTADSLGITDSVSLTSLLKNTQLKGGVIAERSYGKDIDNILTNNKKEANLYFQISSNLGFSLFQMLLKNRVDYIIEYPHVTSYFERTLNKNEETVFIPIEENFPYQLAYVACPRTDWGRKMIDRINTIIREDRPKEEYRKIMEMWLKEEEKEVIKKVYDEIFMKTAEMDK